MSEFTIQLRRDIEADWASKNPILAPGELGIEIDTGRFKMGTGSTPWLALDYHIPTAEIIELINNSSVSPVALDEHINSPTPHPVYDEGPSLVILYENAKV